MLNNSAARQTFAYYFVQDAFSFALVLLCLAVGDIAYVRKKGGIIARTAYYSGWRPAIRKSLRAACPEMAALIKEMWLDDFRARPAMKDVVVRIEACVFVGGVAAPDRADVERLEESSEALQTDNVALLRAARAEIEALRAEKKLDRHELKALRAEKKLDRHEVAELKAALLAGTSVEYDDDFGILGGMFICTSL